MSNMGADGMNGGLRDFCSTFGKQTLEKNLWFFTSLSLLDGFFLVNFSSKSLKLSLKYTFNGKSECLISHVDSKGK